MTILLALYALVAFSFLTRSILILQDEIFCHNSTRGREARVMSKKRITRELTYFLLSILWPVRICIALRDIAANREKLRSLRNG